MPFNEKTKNVLSQILRVTVSLTVLVWLFKNKIDIPQTIHVLRDADFLYLYLGVFIFGGINLVLLLRWMILVNALDLGVPAKNVVIYFFVGLFFNLFLPTSTGGDIVKTLYMMRDTPHKAKVVASVVLDRLIGFASIVLVAFISFVFGYRLIDDPSLLVIILGMAGVCFMVFLVLFVENIYAFCCRIFGKLPKVKVMLMDLHYNIALFKDKKGAMAFALGMALVGQVIFVVTCYLIARGLHQDIDLIYFLIFIPLLCVAASLPSIGGLGVREAGSVYLFGKIGISAGVAASISLITYLFMVIVGLVGGIVYVIALSPRRIQCHQAITGHGSPKA